MGKKKTTEEFKKEVFDLVGKEYSVIGEYINSQTKINMHHNKCDRDFEIRPNDFLRGRRCSHCYKTKKKTHEEFIKEVFDLTKGEYEVLGAYINSDTKVKIRHTICGREYEIKPDALLRGAECKVCKNKKRGLESRKTHEAFLKEAYEALGDDYEILTEYRKNNEKIDILHKACNQVYSTTPSNVLRGSKCFHCFGTKKKTTEEFKKEVYNLVGDEYSVLGEYKNNRDKIKMIHNTCGHIYHVSPDKFTIRNQRCPKCFGTKLKTHEEFKKEVYDLVGDEYEVITEYKNAKTKVIMLHKTCGNKFEVLPPSFTSGGTRCSKCNLSKGESIIKYFLNNNGIEYKTEYRFKDCKFKNTLPFDFAIFKNEELICLIEYDGLQHFEIREKYGGEEEFKLRVIRDSIKDDYCHKNNINLIRIPYWEIDNIHKILGKKLYKLGLIPTNKKEV